MPKFHVGIARFPFGNQEAPSVTDWVMETLIKMKADPRVGSITKYAIDDTPITMGRNRVLARAGTDKVDLLLFVDSDMIPDIGLRPQQTSILNARPFWDTAFDFCLNHAGPCVVAAPYCGPPPWENVYVFKAGQRQSDNPNVDMAIDQFTREEAAQRGGFEEVFALPTGLMLIDMRCLPALAYPYFDYEWVGDGPACERCGQKRPGVRAEKATTEDVYFSRNLALAGVKQYCLWDCWAGHWKRKAVTKPALLTMDAVRKDYRDAIVSGRVSNEQLIMVGEGEK